MYSTIKTLVNNLDDSLNRAARLPMSGNAVIYLCCVALGLMIIGSTAFDRVLREDAYNFIVTGMSIAHGDFDSFQKQSIGWPLFLGAVFWLTQVETVFGAMRLARWTSIILIAVSVVPLTLICRQLLPERHAAAGCLCVMLAFISNPLIHFAGRGAMSEALFILLTMLAIWVFLRRDRPQNIAFTALLLGLAYWVRPNAIFVLVAVIVTIGLRLRLCQTNRARDVLLLVLVFIAVCIPYWSARYLEFGSAFDYGPNSKYFVDNYEQIWADNIQNPSLAAYLSTHSWSDYYDKFFRRGFFRVLNHVFYLLLPLHWVLLTGLSLLFYLYQGLAQRIAIIHMVLGMTVIGMTPVFDIFASVRHLIYVVPFMLLAAAWAASAIDRGSLRLANVLFALLILITLSTITPIKTFGFSHLGLPEVKDHWALWAARNIEGKVVIIEGADILRMSQHYELDGLRVPRRFSEVKRTVNTIRPGIYDNLTAAVEEFRRLGVKYVITDKNHIKRRPYLREIEQDKWSHVFQHIGYFKMGDPGTVLFGVNIYRLNYPDN